MLAEAPTKRRKVGFLEQEPLGRGTGPGQCGLTARWRGGGSHFRGQCEWYGGVVLRGILGWGQARGVS